MQFNEGEGDIPDAPPGVDAPFIPEELLSSFAPEDPTPHLGTDAHGEQEDSAENREDPLEFDPRFRQEFEGLLHLGYLQREVPFLGHRFTIRTIDVDTVLEIGLLHQPYVGTISDLKAYQALLAAACVERLDGRPLAVPIGMDDKDLAIRFNVVRRWFPATLDFVYSEYLKLEARVEEIIEAMKASHSVGGPPGAAVSTPGLTPESA